MHIKNSENFVNGYLTYMVDCTEIVEQHTDNHCVELKSEIFDQKRQFCG